MQTVSTEICELKHEHIDQAFLEDRQRLKSHGEQLDALSRLAAQQTSVIEGMAPPRSAWDKAAVHTSIGKEPAGSFFVKSV